MTRDELIRMAREAGGSRVLNAMVFDCDGMLEQFAALVAAAEREECAKVASTLGVYPELNVFNGGPDWYKHGKNIADAIRARTL